MRNITELISPEYRRLNEELHRRAKYGHRGHRHAADVTLLARKCKARTILDYGCGAGLLADALPEYDVHSYDPCVPRFSADPPQCDIGVCTDVLEHIEPELLDNVLDHLKEKTRCGCYVVIATRHDSTKLLADGSNPHRIVQPAAWWRPRLERHWDVHKWHETVGKQCTFWLIAKKTPPD